MKNNVFRISLVCGIILLLNGLSVTSSISGHNGKMSNQSTFEAHTNFPLGRELLAYWKFDETSGNIAHDSSGNGYHGTVYGATWTGGGLYFDGVDDYVDLDAHSENLGFNKTDNYKISIIGIKSTSTDTGIIYGMSHSIGNRVYVELELNSEGSFIFRVGTEECTLTVSSNPGYNDDTWHFVEAIYYGCVTDPTLEIYVDGEHEDSLTEWQFPFANDDFQTAKIGRKSNYSTNHFGGLIDDVKIHKSVMNSPPGSPIIEGQRIFEVEEGGESTYTIYSIDPEGDDIWIQIDWGDGEPGEWFGPYPSGEKVSIGIPIPLEEGTYVLFKIRVKDFFGAESDWATLTVYVVDVKPTFLLGFIENIEQENNFSLVTVKFLLTARFIPFDVRVLSSGKYIVISNEYIGFVGSCFIIGRFKTDFD